MGRSTNDTQISLKEITQDGEVALPMRDDNCEGRVNG